MDDFAVRRRHRFGTVLVDVATSTVVDLLPDRTASSLSDWLGQREPPELICRDRAGEYATGARLGAPNAVQIADRFHLAVRRVRRVVDPFCRKMACEETPSAQRKLSCANQELEEVPNGNCRWL